MSRQRKLFEEEIFEEEISRSSVNIVLSNASSKKDEKKKVQIRKKIDDIDKLKKKLTQLKVDLAVTNRLFYDQSKESHKVMCAMKEKLLVKLFTRFKENGFTQWQTELLGAEAAQILNDLTMEGYTSDKVEEIQKEWSKIDSEKLTGEDIELRVEFMKGFFHSIGIDVDDEIDKLDMKDPNALDKFQEDFLKKMEAEHNEERKTQEESQKQEQRFNTNTDFKKLYKKLVKEVHPDLAKSEEERKEREDIMKRISVAWDQRNYFELLLIQKELNKKDSSKDVVMESSQLDSVLKQLNEELKLIRLEEHHIKYENEQTAFIYNEIYSKSSKVIQKRISKHIEQIDEMIEVDEIYLQDLKTKKSTKIVLKDLREESSFESLFY